MNLTPIFSDDVASNMYLLQDKKSLMIDAGMDPSSHGKLDYLVLTHCHFDHIAMTTEIQKKSECKILMSEVEAEFFDSNRYEASSSKYSGFPADLTFTIDQRLKDGDKIDIGDVQLEVMLTPGHTPGGICLYEPHNKLLFSGDTVFANGFGRYDLAGGDREALKESIAKLSKLDIAEMFPAHGPALETGVNAYIKSIRI